MENKLNNESMNAIEARSNAYSNIFENSEFGELEVMYIDDKAYFPAAECARILGYTNPHDAVRTHCKGVRETLTPTNGGVQKKNFIIWPGE